MNEKTEEKKKENKYLKWIVISFCILIFFVIYILIMTNNIYWLDNSIYNFIKSFSSLKMTYIMTLITEFGGVIGIAGIMITVLICLVIYKKEKFALGMILNLGFGAVLCFIIKYIVKRPRPPFSEMIVLQEGYSFPSAHTVNNVIFYGFAIYLIYKNVKNKIVRNISCIILTIIPILIGISRIYLRVHYPSDVLAGFAIGILFVIIFVNIIYPEIIKNNK